MMNTHQSRFTCRFVLQLLIAVTITGHAAMAAYFTRTSENWNTPEGEWEVEQSAPSDDGYAPQPDADTLATVSVLWRPIERHPLGNRCRVRGQLQFNDHGQTRNVNWLQAVTLYVVKQPEIRLDWKKGFNLNTAIGEQGISDAQGQFQIEFDLNRVNSLRQIDQQFQFGIALGKWTQQNSLLWNSRVPAIPSSIELLVVPEAAKLTRELELLNKARLWPHESSTGVDLINAANAIRELGKQKALETLNQYAELAPDESKFDGPEIVYWIIRLVFEPIKLDDHVSTDCFLYTMSIGEYRPKSDPWPLDPIELVDDVPFLIKRRGGSYSGPPPEHFRHHMNWVRRHCVIRNQPLVPSRDPITASKALLSNRKLNELSDRDRNYCIGSIQLQAISMLQGILEQPQISNQCCSGVNFDWDVIGVKASELKIEWDSQMAKFVTKSDKQATDGREE